MIDVNEYLRTSIANVEQLKRRRRAEKLREQKRQESIDNSRKFIIGGIVTDLAPQVLRFRPKRSRANNDLEFELIKQLLSELFSDLGFDAKLKEYLDERDKIQFAGNSVDV